MKKTLLVFTLIMLSAFTFNAIAQGAKEFAPGQVKKEEGAQSAKAFAPGQVKKEKNAKSAKEFAPGRQTRTERPYVPVASSPPRAGFFMR